MHSSEDVGETSLSSPPKNVGEDTLPSSPAVPASSPVQRFVAKTPRGTAGDVGATLHVASPPQVVMQDTDLGGAPVETDAPKVKAYYYCYP